MSSPRARILVCAFGPFPGVPVNPSARLARQIVHARRPVLADIELILEILPTRWDALDILRRHLTRHRPDGVLLLGVAPRRQALCVETRAVNLCADRPDVARHHPPARRVDPRAPHVLSCTADVPALLAAARSACGAVRASRDAGRYLCNASYFTALSGANGRPVIFVHVPGRTGRRASAPDALATALGAVLVALAAQAKRDRLRS
ncbi:pyroglutamyl-peptidase I [Xanthobacter variabilis]|uniref:pyroglutamyl-peptidase I family protein n=1 Tax=Xanthobacter variabilis TaxID=3119932 RepID=UPI00372A6FA9